MKIAGQTIAKGANKQLTLSIANLVSATPIEIPVFISRGQQQGPVLLLMAGLHGDEINSVNVVKSIMQQKLNHVDAGCVICIPVVNIFGFIHFSREVPDGKDVNRSFPGNKKGSLASQIAYQISDKILPYCDCIIDFHTGGKSRFNVPQTRAVLTDHKSKELAVAFNAPFNLHSNLIKRSVRETAYNLGKSILVYEGGEALRFNEQAKEVAIDGVKNVLSFLKMKKHETSSKKGLILHKRKWLRAPLSGMFTPTIAVGDLVFPQQTIGYISDPFNKNNAACVNIKKAYVISLNNNPMVNRGDAILQIAYNEEK